MNISKNRAALPGARVTTDKKFCIIRAGKKAAAPASTANKNWTRDKSYFAILNHIYKAITGSEEIKIKTSKT
jgi:hypothetical protein